MATTGLNFSNVTMPTADSSMFGATDAASKLYAFSQANSAFNAQQAALNRTWQERQNRIAMDFNMAEAQKSRDWQEYMSNSAHQREVADLKAAGLNPVLSAMGGNGAAVTSGATASGVTSSGASATADSSANAAFSSILASMLSAQTSLTDRIVSAMTENAIADKYTAMDYLTTSLTNASQQQIASGYQAAQRYGADVSAAASRYGSDQSRAASAFAATQSRAASEYATDHNLYSALLSFADSMLGGDGRNPGANAASAVRDWFNGTTGKSSTPNEITDDWLYDLFNPKKK